MYVLMEIESFYVEIAKHSNQCQIMRRRISFSRKKNIEQCKPLYMSSSISSPKFYKRTINYTVEITLHCDRMCARTLRTFARHERAAALREKENLRQKKKLSKLSFTCVSCRCVVCTINVLKA